MNKFKKLIVIPIMIALIGCGSSGSSSYTSNSYHDDYAAAGAVAESYGAYDAKESMDTDFSNTAEMVRENEKLIYSGDISVETLNYAETVETLREKIKEVEGFIEWQDESDSAGNWYSTTYEKTRGTKSLYMRVRIPSKSFDKFVNDADGLGKVISRSTNVENITKQYNDNETTIESYKIQEKRLLEMMEKAETIEDMITVENRLSEVQSQLRYANDRKSSMDTDVDYSTVTIRISEVMEYTPLETGMVTSNFTRRLVDTLKWTWTFFVWLVQQILLTAIRLLPIVAIAGAVYYVIYLLAGKKFIKIKRVKKEKESEEKKKEA